MNNYKICIIGLGNVGLDLAINFSKKFYTIGYDINKELIKKIKLEKKKHLINSKTKENGLIVSYNQKLIINCDVYIVTVPTPVDKKKDPDLKNVIKVTKQISRFLSKNNIVIYESTFYPGLTEEVCIPLIEKESKLELNKDFFVGYSPERINIGENKKLSKDIIKITSGSNKIASNIIDDLYKTIIPAGTYKVGSIKLAEAVKILENCQRDINIAFMNEMSKFLNRININTSQVIEAASTKWNFAKYYPGLVGGDCIAVDPYYFLHAAKTINLDLPLIKLARKTNEDMLDYIFDTINKKLSAIKIFKLAFFGISYKGDCAQINNSMYLKIAKKLKKKYSVDIYDHLVEKVNKKINLTSAKSFSKIKYDAIIIGSRHKKYRKMCFRNELNKNNIIIDIHGISMYNENSVL